MRRDTLLAVGFLLAGIGELQWATAFFASDSKLLALELFVAGAAFLLVSSGFFFPEGRDWSLFAGFLIAALAHAAYLVSTTGFGAILLLAAALAFVGLAISAWGARSGAIHVAMLRVGLGITAIGGLVWTVSDINAHTMTYMVGNIFTTVGWAAGAAFAGRLEE